MLLKKYKVESYTFTEFKLMQDKELMKELDLLDQAIGHIKRNKKKYMALVLLIALTFDLSTITAFANDFSKLDKAGMTMLELMRRVGYWVGIILCSKDVIKQCMRGHMENIGSIVAMYGLGFGVLYFLPWMFDIIKGIF